MQTTYLLRLVCASIEKICWSFRWGEFRGVWKVHLVSWDKVCQDKELGGLGLRHARDTNLAFMSKLGWGLIHKWDELWVQVLKSRYKCRFDLIHHLRTAHKGSNIWKGIYVARPEVERNLGWWVSDGCFIDFWRDKWLPNCPNMLNAVVQNPSSQLANVKVVDFVSSEGS